MKDGSLFSRTCISVTLFVCCLVFVCAPALAQEEVPTGPPAVENLQAGDLIWPKKPGAIIPYAAPGSRNNGVGPSQLIDKIE